MSGGYFDYRQYVMNEIADNIEDILNNQGKLLPKSQLYGGTEYYLKHPEELFHITFSKEVQDKMKEAVKQLRIASIYAQRVAYFLSDDDGEENFLLRLSEELKDLESKNLKI